VVEKKKHNAKPASKWHILVYLARAILLLPMLCGACLAVINTYDYIQMHQCFDEAEPMERNYVIDYEAKSENPVITQANLSELSLLPYSPDVSIFPSRHYPASISHPDVDYFLSNRISSSVLNFVPVPKHELILCQPNGWASHVLSYGVYGYRFSPDGEHFATGSNYDNLVVYDAKTIELLATLNIPRPTIVVPSWIYTFHPTEPLIAILVTDLGTDNRMSRLHFWNYETQEVFNSILIDDGFPGSFGFLAFNEEGTLLIARRAGATTSSFVWGIPPE
jgi:WD40 repeat protein